MKAQKFSEEIVRVSHLAGCPLLGMNRDGLVTLLSMEDGSILYPHLFGNKFSVFSKHFFYFEDKNGLPFFVEASAGKIVTLDNFSDLVEENRDLNIEEKAKIRKFYRKYWDSFNNEYYIYDANYISLSKSLVKKDTLEPKLKAFSNIKYDFSDNKDIAIIVYNDTQKLYNINSNCFFEIAEYSIIDPIEQTPFILVGNDENKLRLYRIKGDKEIEAIFDDSNLYVSKKDIFKLKNGRFLINVKNEEVYIVW